MFENLHTSEKYKLTQSEKVRMRNELVAFMAEHPVKQGVFARVNGFFAAGSISTPSYRASYSMYALRSVAAALVVVLVGGTGTAYAAENALPGDVLYTVKVNVNERALELAATSAKAKAEVSAKRAERRLQEAEQLAVAGRLDTETKIALGEQFNKHAEEFVVRAEVLTSSDDIESAAEVSSDLEAALSAHEGILETVLAQEPVDSSTESDTSLTMNATPSDSSEMALMTLAAVEPRVALKQTSATVSPPSSDELITKVQLRKAIVSRIREVAEAKLVARDAGSVKPAAEKKFVKAQVIAKSVRKDAPQVANDNSVNADINVQSAEAELDTGKRKLEGGAYGEAFASFQKAVRTVQETKLSIDAGTRLKVGIPVRVNVAPVVTPEPETILPTVEATTTATTTIEVETESSGELNIGR